jgi:phage host-nuclease inhibitor protein Gam
MTTDTIKQLGAEFHHAADSLADTLARLDNARRERLTFLRRCSKDSTARLATLKEEVRTLPEQIAKWDAEAARLESQTAEDLLRQALEVAPKCDGDHKGPLCDESHRRARQRDAVRTVLWLGTRAADGVGEALRRLEHARADRLAFLRRCSKDSTARLATLKEEVRTLPEQIAKWDAEAARLESQTAEDLLRQALEPARKEKPEPYRAGLPPERLRKVWAEWEGEHGTRVRFSGERGENYEYDKYPGHTAPADAVVWTGKYRPHGATWARVEAMADEAERALPRPVENCGHVAADGTCGHPNALTPECHDGVVCPVKAEKQAGQYACDFCRDGRRFMTAVDAVNGDGTVTNPRPAPCLVCGRTERAQDKPTAPPAPPPQTCPIS